MSLELLRKAGSGAGKSTRALPAPRSAYADEFVDETLRQTFPASDPPSWWAGPPS